MKSIAMPESIHVSEASCLLLHTTYRMTCVYLTISLSTTFE
jgi:hypothetical protein